MLPITTRTDKCRKCYSCVRSCPVKAIKVEDSSTDIIIERCIGCGNCLDICPQNAKVLTDKTSVTEGLLSSGRDVIAVLGSSFPAFFHDAAAGQLVTGLKRLGFMEVHEGAYGVELVAAQYAEAMEKGGDTLISSHCPAVVDLIERHYPKLLKNLVPIVSPMIAMGRYLKEVAGPDVAVVYISSCVAGKFEADSREAKGAIDVLLTYNELAGMFKNRGIALPELPAQPFDGIEPHLGRLFPISEGTFKAFGIATDPLESEIITAEGEVNVMDLIGDLARGRIQPRIADIRFCYDACIGGPGKNRDLTRFLKRNLIISHFKGQIPYDTAGRYRQTPVTAHLSRSFSNKFRKPAITKGGDITRILHLTNKFSARDELNCRACGYRTCREYAVAVHQGLADLEMCLPWNLQRLEEDRGNLMQKYELARRELDREFGDQFMVGTDAGTLEVLELVKQVGPTPTTVLIRGESGTGKELTARAIHRCSLRNDKPLVTVNCTTITDSLLESELFGHKKGAFTGAVAEKKGLFEAADGGTIFLDEIGDITPKLQAELLRVLDTGEVRPVGGTQSKIVDVRLIAATNKNLDQGIVDGWFREDLFYRLNVFTISLPPLRERVESIPQLAHHFLDKASAKLNKKLVGIEERAIKAMMHYPWTGNIREMQNIMERAAVLTQDDIIRLENLPTTFARDYAGNEEPARLDDPVSLSAARELNMFRVERDLLQRYILQAEGNMSRAAKLAGMPRRTFYRLLEKHGVKGRILQGKLAKNQGNTSA